MLNENFYISLKKLFKDQNITQQQVADKLGTSQAYHCTPNATKKI